MLFSTLFFFHACFVNESLMYFCFWESSRKAAHAKMTRKRGRSRQKTKRTQSSDLQVMPRLLVICACAASRWPSEKQKCVRESVTAQARKNKKVENNKKARIGSRFFQNNKRYLDMSIASHGSKRVAKSLLHLGPFIFATRSEAQKVIFSTPGNALFQEGRTISAFCVFQNLGRDSHKLSEKGGAGNV